MTTNRSTPDRPQISIDATDHPGFAHYEAMKPRFAAQKPTRAVLNVDLDLAGQILIEVKKAIDARGLMATLKSIPASLYDAERAADLDRYGWALRFIATMRKRESAALTSMSAPPALIAQAEALRARMLKVARHFLGESPRYAVELESIAEGRGFADLAQDLIRLVLIYKTEVALLSVDPVHYRASDVEEAQACYLQITEALRGEVTSAWGDVALEAFSFIEREYWHLRQTAAWLWREEPEIVALFPTLFVRSAPGKAVLEEQEASDDPVPAVEEKKVDVAPVG